MWPPTFEGVWQPPVGLQTLVTSGLFLVFFFLINSNGLFIQIPNKTNLRPPWLTGSWGREEGDTRDPAPNKEGLGLSLPFAGIEMGYKSSCLGVRNPQQPLGYP